MPVSGDWAQGHAWLSASTALCTDVAEQHNRCCTKQVARTQQFKKPQHISACLHAGVFTFTMVQRSIGRLKGCWLTKSVGLKK
jgi:hypothetical protein